MSIAQRFIGRFFSGDRRRDLVFAVTATLISLAALCLPTGQASPFDPARSERVKARIVAVNNDLMKIIGPVKQGSQQLVLRLESGRFKGRNLDATNNLNGKIELDKVFRPGDAAFAVLDLTEDGTDIAYVNVIDHYRLDMAILLVLAFAAELVHTLVGSFGLILVAPLTAVAGGFLLSRGQQPAIVVADEAEREVD